MSGKKREVWSVDAWDVNHWALDGEKIAESSAAIVFGKKKDQSVRGEKANPKNNNTNNKQAKNAITASNLSFYIQEKEGYKQNIVPCVAQTEFPSWVFSLICNPRNPSRHSSCARVYASFTSGCIDEINYSLAILIKYVNENPFDRIFQSR